MQDANTGYVTVKRQNTTEIIVENLLQKIKEKELKPGDKLPPERELAAMMNTSRPSLREAIKALQMMNVLDVRQGAGTYIKHLETESIVDHLDIVFKVDDTLRQDLYEARELLESAMARMAVLKMDEQTIGAIRENVRRGAENVENPDVFLQLDIELHELILNAVDNRILNMFIQSINKISIVMRKKTNSSLAIRKKAVTDHNRIWRAIEKRDAAAVGAAMMKHLKNVEKYYVSQTSGNGKDNEA